MSLKLAFVPIFVFRSLDMDSRNINRDLYDWLMERDSTFRFWCTTNVLLQCAKQIPNQNPNESVRVGDVTGALLPCYHNTQGTLLAEMTEGSLTTTQLRALAEKENRTKLAAARHTM
jgi:hypothetical protein